jgi:FG-GAP-like repeat
MRGMKSLAFAMLLLVPVAVSAQTFERPLVMPGIGQPIGAADVNGDGQPDLVSRSGADLLVYLADGSGHLRPPIRTTVGQYHSDYVQNDELSVALGDFNGDGRIDAAAARRDDVSVLLGDGAGGFLPASVVPAGAIVTEIVARDMNGDGKLDLVMTQDRRYVRLFRGDGAGHFTQTAAVDMSYVDRMVVGDLNGDGKPDVIVDMTSSGRAALLPGDGAGGLGPRQGLPGINMFSGTVADFNEDGVPDLLFTGAGSVGVALGGPGALALVSINFAASPDVGLMESIQGTTAGDLNGDGHQDAVLLESLGAAWVALGDGRGRFSVPVRVDAPNANGHALWSATVADVNGDGYGDLVAGMVWCVVECQSTDGYNLFYAPTTVERARTTEALVKTVEGTVGSLANLLATTAVSLDRLSSADFAKLTALDVPVSSRASQSSVDTMSSELHALGAALVTLPAAGALQAAIADVRTATTSAIDSASNAATRIAIERALGDGVSVIWFMLPAAQNGQLDTVRQIVTDSIAGLQAIGVHISRAAMAAFAKAETAFTSGEYVSAYSSYAQAYQGLR